MEEFPDDLALPLLSKSHSTQLAAPFTSAEVFKTLKSMPKNKCPGPDGFPVQFFLESWSVVGGDVTKAILHFFDTLHIPRIINSVALALVPKQVTSTTMHNFRPISCCNVLYKCISKMLAARMKLIMSSIISECQSAFVPKRLIGYNVLFAQSLCRNYHLMTGEPKCALKLDLQKAFDTISWSFLNKVLEKMGFPGIFINWLMTCLSSCMLSVKVNGALEGFFLGKVWASSGRSTLSLPLCYCNGSSYCMY